MSIQIDFAVADHNGDTKGAFGSRLINLYAEPLPPGAKSGVILKGTPGTELFCALPTRPVLAMEVMNNALYAVTATNLYRIDNFGTYTDLGLVEMLGDRVDICTNGTNLVMVDGILGYSYTEDDGISQLSGDGWYVSESVDVLDGYFIFVRKDTGQFFLSDLLSDTFDPLKFATAEAAPDDLKAVVVFQQEAFMFGKKTAEVWYTGIDPDFPLERRSGAFIDRGIASPHCAVNIDNSVYWLGEDRIVYRMNGYVPIKVSNFDVDTTAQAANVDDAHAYTYIEDGHKFYVLTLPTANLTYALDLATGLWHQRSHSRHGRHHGNCHVFTYNYNLIGDFQAGAIYHMHSSIPNDSTDHIQRIGVSPPVHFDRTYGIIKSFELDMDTGVWTIAGDGQDPVGTLSWSGDGGETWSHEREASIGKMGQYRYRARWLALGADRQRQFKFAITSPVPVRIYGAWIEVKNARN